MAGVAKRIKQSGDLTNASTAAPIKRQRGVSGSPYSAITQYTVSVTPASVNAATAAAQDVTVTGVLSTDLPMGLQVPAPANQAVPVMFRVKSANTVTVVYINPTAGALTPGSGNYTFVVMSI